ncbi:DUF6114 domain-containing protein [Streptomyces spiramyceticus]|uniref:DUF6114 domain-containing protein n=1 Tax=Streptomyces spiramyceticus TaxID=299717 RepID=UPI00237A618D|nr:DUF6114 domain-containing protein [Streptomyces spiramyceticus]
MITLILGFGAELAKETATWLDRLLPAPRLRARARSWRRRRPFWAGLWTALAGLEMIFLPLAPLPLMLKVGVGAMSALGVGLVLIAGGLFFVFAPAQRMFVSVMTAIASLVSLATTNLGGFGIGVGLGLLGSSMAFGWLPGAPEVPGSGRGWVRSDAAAGMGRRSPRTAGGDSEVPGAPECDGSPARGGRRGRTGSQPFVPAAWGVEGRDPKGRESRAVRRSSAVPGVPGGDCAALVRRLLAVPLALTLAVGVLGVSPGRSGAAERCGEPEREVLPRPPAECPEAAGHTEEEPQASGDGGNVTLPCLTGVDTGGRDNPPAAGDPPSRQTAEPGKVGRPGDLSALKPPLVVGKQPGPGRATYPVSPYHPEVGATRLDAYDAVIHGATYLPTIGGGRVKVLWVHAERLVAKDYHFEVTGPDGTPQTIDVQLDIRNVDVYATELTGSIEIPFLKVNTPRICIGADVVPANLPVAVQLPRLTVESVEAGQVLVDAADVRFSGLTTRTSN